MGVAFTRKRVDEFSTLRQGLVGAWCPSLPNGGSGNLLPDVSGYGNHGTLVNMSPDDWVSSQYGRALDFDGVNDVVVSSAIGVSYSAFTACCWVKGGADIGTDAQLFSQYNTTDNQRAWQLGVRSSGIALQVIVSSDGTTSAVKQYESTANVFDGSWKHVAMRFESNNLSLFSNGIELGVTKLIDNTVNTVSNLSAKIVIGGRQAGASYATYAKALIDDARIYNRPLTDSEIKLLASKRGIGLEPRKPDITYYPFPSGSRRRRLLTGMP